MLTFELALCNIPLDQLGLALVPNPGPEDFSVFPALCGNLLADSAFIFALLSAFFGKFRGVMRELFSLFSLSLYWKELNHFISSSINPTFSSSSIIGNHVRYSSREFTDAALLFEGWPVKPHILKLLTHAGGKT